MFSPAEAMVQARQFHQAGYLSQAAQLYRQILQDDPANGDVWLRLGNALLSQAQLKEAADAFWQCIKEMPDCGEAYLKLAHALQRQGNSEAAVNCLRDCLQRLPQFPEAHNNLANALLSLGRLEEAASHYREALQHRPDFAEGHKNLANALIKQGQVDEAIGHLEEARRLKPTYAEAHLSLAAAYHQRNELPGAIRSYQRALELKPDFSAAHNALGEVFLEQGDPERAELHLRKALPNNPRASRSLLNLATFGLYKPSDPSIDTLRRWLSQTHLPEEAAGQLHCLLGILLDRAGDYGEAFAHFRAGNALRHSVLRRSGKAFDPAAHTRQIDQVMAAFSPEYFRRVQSFGLVTPLPVFIVGMPRSGTTLMEQILSHHPNVFGAGELFDLARIVTELPEKCGAAEGYPECLCRLDAAVTRDMAAVYLQGLTTRSGPAERVTDKMMGLFLYLGLVATLFPRAHIIWCRRDPRDVCLSCYFQWFAGLNFTLDLQDLGQYHRDFDRLMAHWQKVLPLPILQIVYEDLVADQETVSRRLVEFCGLSWDERCLRFHENRRPVKTMSAMQVRQPLYKTSVGRWRCYTDHLGPLFKALDAPAGRT
jgi:tetratricopeptide (TPR) repeat protein